MQKYFKGSLLQHIIFPLDLLWRIWQSLNFNVVSKTLMNILNISRSTINIIVNINIIVEDSNC